MPDARGMDERLIIVDGYNLILRSPHLQPGPGRTLRESRDKLVNLLSWAMGGDAARFLVVFDGARDAPAGGGGGSSGRVQVRFSRPPQTADDLIRELVEEHVERVDQLTVVTADLEVARHARAMGADVSIADLFLAAAIDPGGEAPPEKPTTLSRAEVEEWAKLFRSRPRAPGDEDAPN
ncbi:MAG TPA: NYN domain-containing protein [Candidatus Eisenbacteria bacterium]|nr:NYN domain-containing protein [Candidatus Eisenbacteria bacterium]